MIKEKWNFLQFFVYCIKQINQIWEGEAEFCELCNLKINQIIKIDILDRLKN